MIKSMTSLIFVRDIDNIIHQLIKYILVTFYVNETLSSFKSVVISIIREVYLVNNLKINMLIDIDILVSERMILNMNLITLFIKSCKNLTIIINVMIRKNSNSKRTVRVKDRISISSHSQTNISILVRQQDQLSNDRDLIFESCYDRDFDQSDDLYAHVVNVSLSFVQIRNAINRLVTVQRYAKLRKIVKFSKKECFLVDSSDHSLATIE